MFVDRNNYLTNNAAVQVNSAGTDSSTDHKMAEL
jgi:hypothetical protein